MLSFEDKIKKVNKARFVLAKNNSLTEAFNDICNEYINDDINIESLLDNIIENFEKNKLK